MYSFWHIYTAMSLPVDALGYEEGLVGAGSSRFDLHKQLTHGGTGTGFAQAAEARKTANAVQAFLSFLELHRFMLDIAHAADARKGCL
jgi:hypothetical protein